MKEVGSEPVKTRGFVFRNFLYIFFDLIHLNRFPKHEIILFWNNLRNVSQHLPLSGITVLGWFFQTIGKEWVQSDLQLLLGLSNGSLHSLHSCRSFSLWCWMENFWKKLVLHCPYWSHLTLAFWFQKNSSCCSPWLNSKSTCFLERVFPPRIPFA